MMKKLLVVMLVFGMASAAWAAPYFAVNVADKKDHYVPSDWITIDLVNPDFPAVSVMVDAITDNPGGAAIGMAAGPQVFHPNFTTQFPGQLNADGLLVEYMGAADGTVPARGAAGILYSFEYHVPDVPYSTYIDIQSYADGELWYDAELVYAGSGGWIGTIHTQQMDLIHVVPEPATIALLGFGGLLLRRRKK